ncbi:hypothetical protein PUNSTDRAFT_115729 [Punctularia strigosozonata HHB-11173 SS5]|uniref:uncharacterized protein n=1 Tax=Punctularia strigosozonata (strain HHB-11173) TaxID=741275 RepID=UPI0004416FC2|nr:uncharacterized protein PUNSTDRAFT_115729 [Punctularia strigosozonata HHB-11173 SS5]EIN05818.1 hypothetical protein PUNSTDRAFT_115729 [Punctularia strigosozonata HHB-11173 SS5]
MSSAISLNFPQRLHIAGEVLSGSVNLDLAAAQEDDIENIIVKFRGSIQTMIRRTIGQETRVYRSNTSVLNTDIPLWQRGQPGSGTITLPFNFQLLPNLPPSYHVMRFDKQGTITYYLEVVGERPGLHFNRRIRSVIALIPGGWPANVQIRQGLLSGWGPNMPWKAHTHMDSIRQGIWGDHSQVRVELRLPDIAAFPYGTPIPVRLDVVTTTKPLKQDDIPDENDDKALFPAPPTAPALITFRVDRHTQLAARHVLGTTRETVSDEFDNLAGFGEDDPSGGSVRCWQDPPIWAAAPKEEHHHRSLFHHRDKEGGDEKRVCTRATHFETVVQFTFPPNFQTEHITTTHTLHVCVPFPGIGNDLKLDIPINIVSGYVPQTQPMQQYQPAAAMNLPPAYWSAEDHEFDEKD